MNPENPKKRHAFAWILWTFGHDPFSALITSFVFAAYFTSHVASSSQNGSIQWAWANAIGAMVIAVLAPFLGSLADVRGRYKGPLAFFTLLMIVATAALFFTQPNPHWALFALIAYGVGLASFELGIMYYNALLKRLSHAKNVGRLSGISWASGYFGGIIVLLIALYVFIQPHLISHSNALNVRIVPVFVAVWAAVFCLPLFLTLPENNPTENLGAAKSLKASWQHLIDTCRQSRRYHVIFRFVIARLFYNDAINTVFAFAGVYATLVFHFTLKEVLVFAISANVVSGIGTILWGFVDDWLGPRFVLFWSIVLLLVGVIAIFVTHNLKIFWVFGLLIASIAGPIQASSRSYLTHMSPKRMINQLFGFYTLTGRATAFIGPLLTGIFIESLHDVRAIMLIVFVLALIGLLIFVTLPAAHNVTLSDE